MDVDILWSSFMIIQCHLPNSTLPPSNQLADVVVYISCIYGEAGILYLPNSNCFCSYGALVETFV